MAGRGSFKGLDAKTKTMVVINIGLLAMIALTVVFSGFFFGMVGLFKLLGVTYTSVWALILFAILIFALGFLFEMIAKMIKAYSRQLKPSRHVRITWGTVVDVLFTWLTIYTVDEIVASVSMVLWAEWVFALLLVLVDYVYDERKTGYKKFA